MIETITSHMETAKTWLQPGDKLRYINWYTTHGCDLSCSYCQVPKQKVKVMNPDDRKEALRRLSMLSSNNAIMTIVGGEPTLRPDFFVETVQDAASAGFMVSAVSNGWGLNEDLIGRLGGAGLSYLAISVDHDPQSPKTNLDRALGQLQMASARGIIPVVNSVLTSRTNVEGFKNFTRTILDYGIFLNPLTCSPSVPGGVFSSATEKDIPSREQLRALVPWLAVKKVTTGKIAASFGYLWELFNLKENRYGTRQPWHCSSHFRGVGNEKGGRGFLTLDSDGYIGPCQEFPRQINLLGIPAEELSLQLLDPQFSETTVGCSGCTYSCYMNEEKIGNGPLSIIHEATSVYQYMKVLNKKP